MCSTLCSCSNSFYSTFKSTLKSTFHEKIQVRFFSVLDYVCNVLTPTLDSSLELAQADSQTLEAISKACKK